MIEHIDDISRKSLTGNNKLIFLKMSSLTFYSIDCFISSNMKIFSCLLVVSQMSLSPSTLFILLRICLLQKSTDNSQRSIPVEAIKVRSCFRIAD